MKAIRKAQLMQAVILLALLPSFAWLPMTSYANPAGEIVIHGDVSFARDGNTLNISQFSDKAIIHWEDFSIGANQATIFSQPGASASVLNRVTGPNASSIQGALQANGNVWLINPNGILFGPGSVVDVNGMLASTLNVTDQNFLNGGDIQLQGTSNAMISNYGKINAAGGDVYFAGTNLQNHGHIGAVDGRVIFAGGSDVLIEAGPNGNVFVSGEQNGGAHILNNGEIVAPEVWLAAHGNNVMGAAVQIKGSIRANTVTNEGGRVVLKATNGGGVDIEGDVIADGDVSAGSVEIGGGEINISSMVSASSNSANGGSIAIDGSSVNLGSTSELRADGISGGEILVTGSESVTALGSMSANGTGGYGGEIAMTATGVTVGGDISATGDFGGGEVKIGGGLQGGDSSLANSQSTSIISGASIDVSATSEGDGGTAIVWSDGDTTLESGAEIKAEGAGIVGNGGFVEVSGVESISFAGAVSTAGPGEAGTLLLDPTDVTVDEAGGPGVITYSALELALASGNVVIHTTGTGGAGDVTFANSSGITHLDPMAHGAAFKNPELFVYESDNHLSVFAHNDIFVEEFINNDGAGNITLVAGWNEGAFAGWGGGPSDTTLEDVTATRVLAGDFGSYGYNGEGDINLNPNSNATVGIGSAHGETNLFANSIFASTGNANGEFVQIGYTNTRNPYSGTLTANPNAIVTSVGDVTRGNANAGDINVYANGTTVFLANGGNARYMQIGHGGVHFDDDASRDAGNLGLVEDLTGHDGWGNINGNITVDGGALILFQGNGHDSGYRMIGHGGGTDENFILGNLSGDINVTAGSVSISSGHTWRSWSQIGHGGLAWKGEHSGDIDVTATVGNIQMEATQGTGNHTRSWTQIGHGGINSDHINSRPIDIVYQSTDPTLYNYSPNATGSDGENREGFESASVGQVRDAHIADGYTSIFFLDETVEVNGVSGLSRKAGHHGDIDVTAAGSIRFVAGTDNDDYAQIGHGGRNNTGYWVGDITVEAQNGSVVFDRSMRGIADGTAAYVQIGHGGTFSGGAGVGHISVTAGNGNFEMYGGRSQAYAQVGHGGRWDMIGGNNTNLLHDSDFAQGTHSGNISVSASQNIIGRAGFGRGGSQYFQIGHGGYENAAGVVEVDENGQAYFLTEDLNQDGDTADARETDQLIGEGHNGNIDVTAGGYIDLYSGQREFATMDYVETSPGVFDLVEILPSDELRNGQDYYEANAISDAFVHIGHGGRRSFGSHYGTIDVNADGLISIEGTGGWQGIGYENNPETSGSPFNQFDESNDDSPSDVANGTSITGISGIPRYNTGDNGSQNGYRNFAMIGHGGHNQDSGNNTIRTRWGAQSRGYGYYGDSSITVNSTNGGIRVVAPQQVNIGRQPDTFFTYDRFSDEFFSADQNPLTTNNANAVDVWTQLYLPGAVQHATEGFAQIGHGGLRTDIQGVDDVANTGRAPGHYGDITVTAAEDIDLIASDFEHGVEVGTDGAASQGINPVWMMGSADNTTDFFFEWELYNLAFYVDIADGELDGFVDAGDTITVDGYTVPGGPTLSYSESDRTALIEALNADNGSEYILADGVINNADGSGTDRGFRTITPYFRVSDDGNPDDYNASTNTVDMWAQIGHGGRGSDQGVVDGDITVTSTNGGLHLDAGASIRTWAKVGHGGYGGGVDLQRSVEGEINVDVLGDIRLDAGQREFAYAQIGHGGVAYSSGNRYYEVRNSDIDVISHQGDITLDSDNYYAEDMNPNSPTYREYEIDPVSGERVLLVRDFNYRSTVQNLRNHRGEYTMIGHGGYQIDPDVDADINVEATNGSLTLKGGPIINNYSMIGHGGAYLDNGPQFSTGHALLGDITVDAYGDIIVDAGDMASDFDFFGNGSVGGITDIQGEPIFNVAIFPNEFSDINTGRTLGYYSFAMIGSGGNRLGNSNGRGVRIEGDINVNQNLTAFDPEADLIVRAGDGPGAFAQVGHGGQHDESLGVEGDINVYTPQDVKILGGERFQNGLFNAASSRNDPNFENYAQIGHSLLPEPGRRNGSSEGDISVLAGRDIFLLAGGGTSAHARIGNGATYNSVRAANTGVPTNDQTGDHVGNITVTAGGDLIMQGSRVRSADEGNQNLEVEEGEEDPVLIEDGLFSFAQIGNGGAGVNSIAGFSGDINVRVGGDLQMNGEAVDEDGNPITLAVDTTLGNAGDAAQAGYASDAYVKIGHGDYLWDNDNLSGTGFAYGDVNVAVGGSANIIGGAIGHEGTGNLLSIDGDTFIGVSRNDPQGTGVLNVQNMIVPAAVGTTTDTLVQSNFNSGLGGDLRLYMPTRASNQIETGTILNGGLYLAPTTTDQRIDEFLPYPEFTFGTDAMGLPTGSFTPQGPYTNHGLGSYNIFYANGTGLNVLNPGTPGSGGGGGDGGGIPIVDDPNDLIDSPTVTPPTVAPPVQPAPPRLTPFQLALIQFFNQSNARILIDGQLNPDLAASLELLREFYGDPSNGTEFSIGYKSQGVDSSDMDVAFPGPGTLFEVFDCNFLFNYMTAYGAGDVDTGFMNLDALLEVQDSDEDEDTDPVGTPNTDGGAADPFSFE